MNVTSRGVTKYPTEECIKETEPTEARRERERVDDSQGIPTYYPMRQT